MAKFWEANSSGVANGEAKAYVLHTAGGKVFVTGQIILLLLLLTPNSMMALMLIHMS
ncbi:MAG: hypothetical protein IPG89_11050 [Bacteroidetes bacterium]|nr:hypothetical protein [Bacteroidota bacterium]